MIVLWSHVIIFRRFVYIVYNIVINWLYLILLNIYEFIEVDLFFCAANITDMSVHESSKNEAKLGLMVSANDLTIYT